MMVAPGTPPEQVAALRAAFDQVVKDQEFITEAKKLRLDLTPSRGEDLQALIKNVMNQPPEVIERIKKLIVQ
jgi:tripartite-type tricarboxylate transporter receptor subunit TctC